MKIDIAPIIPSIQEHGGHVVCHVPELAELIQKIDGSFAVCVFLDYDRTMAIGTDPNRPAFVPLSSEQRDNLVQLTSVADQVCFITGRPYNQLKALINFNKEEGEPDYLPVAATELGAFFVHEAAGEARCLLSGGEDSQSAYRHAFEVMNQELAAYLRRMGGIEAEAQADTTFKCCLFMDGDKILPNGEVTKDVAARLIRQFIDEKGLDKAEGFAIKPSAQWIDINPVGIDKKAITEKLFKDFLSRTEADNIIVIVAGDDPKADMPMFEAIGEAAGRATQMCHVISIGVGKEISESGEINLPIWRDPASAVAAFHDILKYTITPGLVLRRLVDKLLSSGPTANPANCNAGHAAPIL